MSGKDSTEGDMHSHLKDIESRMSRTTSINESMKDVEAQLESHLKSAGDKQRGLENDGKTAELRNKLKSLEKEYDEVSRESESLAAPKSSSGQGLISPSKKSAARRQQKSNNPQKGNDVEFAASLSEQLLGQCRRLNAMLTERDKAIKDLEAEKDQLAVKSSSLESQVSAMSESEERFKDENWNLELKVRELQSQANKHSEHLNRANNEAGKLQTDKNTQLETIESLKVKEDELRKQIATLKGKYDTDLNAERTKNDDLKADNTQLQQRVTDLRQELESRPQLGPPIQDDELREAEFGDLSNDGGFDTPDNSPPVSPVKATPSRNSALEAETVKSSLGHAHKMVLTLRKQLVRERHEKSELERMLQDTRDELEDSQHTSGNTSATLKSKRSKHFPRGGLAVVRKTKSRIYSDKSDHGKAEGWEETTSESEFQSAFETAPDDPTDDNYQTGQETLDEDSGQDTETEDTAPQEFGFQVENSALSSSSDEDVNDTLTQNERKRRNSRYRRPQVHHSPQPTDTEDTPVKKSLASEFMSVEEIEQHAADHGLVAVPNEEYEDLVDKAQAAAAPANKEDLEKAAAALSMEVVPVDHYKSLQKAAEDAKSQDYVIKAAEGFGLVAIGRSAYDKLKKPTSNDIHEHAQTLGLRALKSEDYDKMVSDHDSLVTEHGKIVKEHEAMVDELKTAKENHEAVLKEQADLSIAHEALTKEHESLNTRYLQSTGDYEQLQNDHQSSKEAHAAITNELDQARAAHTTVLEQLEKAQADHTNLVDEHSKLTGDHAKLVEENNHLQEESARDLTPEELSSRAGNIGHVAITSDEYFGLVRASKNPTVEELQKGAKQHDMVTIHKNEHDRLVELADDPPEDHLKNKASVLGFQLLDLSYYKELKRQASKPSVDELKERAEGLGMVAVSKTEFNTLTQQANEPTLDELAERVKAHNSRIVKDQDYDELYKRAHEPDAQHVTSKAPAVGLRALPVEEHDELVKRAHEPDEDHVKSKAAALGLVALGLTEHKKLQRAVEKPTKDELEAKAKDLGLVTLHSDAHEEMSRAANAPTVEEVQSRAKALGYTTVIADDYDKLVQRANEPTADEIKAHAEKHNLVALPADEHSKLVNPTAEDVENAAKIHGLVAVPVAKYKDIKDAAEAPPTKSWVESAAASLGLATLGTTELTKLRQPPPEPTLEDARSVSDKHGHTVIANNELHSLKNPDTEAVQKMAAKHGHVTVANDKYEDLVKPYTPSKEEVEAKAESFGLVTLPEKEYTKLTADLSKDQVVSKLKPFNLVAVPLDEYNELTARPKEYKPSENELHEHAKLAGLVALPIAEHDSLSKRATEPSRDILDKSASKHGMVLMPVNEVEELKRKASSPNKDELSTMATQAGFALVSVSGLQELNKKATEPSKDVVLSTAEKHGLSMIPIDEFKELRRQIEAPTFEEAKNAGNLAGLKPLLIQEYQELNRKAEEPTVAEIELACEANGMVAVSKSEYETLEQNAEQPDRELVNKHAVRLGLGLMTAAEIEELKRKANAPTKEDVESMAKKHSLVAIPKDQYAAMIDKSEKHDKMSRSSSSSNALMTSSVAAKRDHFEDMIKQSKGNRSGEKIVESMRSLGYVPVAKDEYERLLEAQSAFEPTRREVLRHVKNLGMVAMPVEEYKLLVKRGHVKSSSVSSDVVEEASRNQAGSGSPLSTSPGRSPRAGESSHSQSNSLSGISGMEMSSVPAEYLTTLRRIAETPTQDDVRSLSQKVGLVALPAPENDDGDLVAVASEEYEQLKNYTVDEDVVAARAKELGMVVMTSEEYEDMTKQPEVSHDKLASQAKDLGLAVLGANELNKLHNIDDRAREAGYRKDLTGDEVKQEAEKHGLVVIDGDEYKQLQAQTQTQEQQRESVSSVYMSAEQMQQQAEQSGHKVVPVSEYEALQAKAQHNMSHAELSDAARGLGLVVVSSDEFRRLSNPPPTQSPTPRRLSLEEVKSEAKKHGMVVLSENESSTSAARGMPQSTSEATLKEARGSPVYINTSPRHEVQSAVFEDTASEASDEGVQHAHQQYHQLPAVVETGVARNVSGVSQESSQQPAQQRLMEAPSFYPPQRNGSTHNYSPSARSATSHVGASNATITTALSFTERNMIPYVTQTMIGEFLYKYKRRIAVSGISDTRHQRYFWVHPYTLTLYWSKDNPAVVPGAKTRMAGIVSVRTVDDPNPIPPGIHHKSLMIETTERTLKVTCQSRSRHNVWYNALQYLLKRSAENLVFDEEEEEPPHQPSSRPVDARFERERAKTVTSSSTTKSGGSKVLNLRRSLAPEMNNTQSSRQPSYSSFQRPQRSPQRNPS